MAIVQTTYRYTSKSAGETSQQILDSTGVRPLLVTPVPVPTIEVVTEDALSAGDKANLDQFMIDRGYEFTSKDP